MATSLHLLLLLLLLVAVSASTAEDLTSAGCGSYRCGAVEIRYPLWVEDGHGPSAARCGYPSLRLDCRRDTPVLHLPSGDYAVTRVLYAERTMSLVDLAVASTACPNVAGRNLTLPPPLALTARNGNLTFLLNCSFVGFAPGNLVPCLQSGNRSSYLFRDGVVLQEDARLCQGVVATPVLNPLDDVVAALRTGFEVSWRPAAGGECAACEKDSGMCGHRRETPAS